MAMKYQLLPVTVLVNPKKTSSKDHDTTVEEKK
jgi:hypothetical protein